jgi:hypothetical protein
MQTNSTQHEVPKNRKTDRISSSSFAGSDDIEVIGMVVVDSAFEVHKALGPGLLESAYQACLVHELRSRGLRVEQEVPVPLVYKKLRIRVGYRIDLRVQN